jgi:sulfatase modifying factor 1
VARCVLRCLLIVLAATPALAQDAAARTPPAGERFVLVAGGSFQMGDLWGDAPWALPEAPPREVEVDDFLLARYEVTVAEFARFVDAAGYRTVAEDDGPEMARRMRRSDPAFEDTGRYPYWRGHDFAQGPDHPVVMIAWEDAIAYCNWLSRQERLPPAYETKSGRLLTADGRPTADVRRVAGYRLPTEAEWEFAARERGRRVRFGNGQDVARSTEMNFDAAGTGRTVPSLRLPKGSLCPYAEPGIHRKATTPVGSFPPNALGLYDMSGNAWEWCADTGGPSYPTEKRRNPCAQGGTTHVLRGGTHDTDARACRASARIDWGARSYCFGSGLRVARTVDAREDVRRREPAPP